MNQKTEQFFPSNSNSQLTYTKRKDSGHNFFDREHNTEINPRIFKYPYLVERSSEKFKQDNESNKSTEKRPKRNRHRKKIFEGTSAKSSDIRPCSLSVDRNRIYQKSNFENNPIQSKLSNKSKNKSRSVYSRYNETNSYVRPVSANVQMPVIFHYSTPQSNPAYYAPVKSTMIHHTSSTPIHQTQFVPYPLPNSVPHIIRPSSFFPIQSIPARSELTPYYLPVNSQTQKFGSELPSNPRYSHIETFHKPSNISNNLDSSPSNKKQINSQSLSFSPFPQSKASPNQQSSTSKPIVVRSMNINQPILLLKPQQYGKNDKKPFLREFSQAPSEVHMQKNMTQTFKTGQKFRPQSYYNGESPQIRHQSSYKNFQNKNHLSPYNKGLYDQSEIDIHQVDDLNAIEDEQEQKYSDRFFDVDFRQAKRNEVHQSQKYYSKSPLLEKITSLNIEKEKFFNQKGLEKDGEEKNLKFQRKGTITSIKLVDRKQRHQNKINQKFIPIKTEMSKFQNILSNIDKQGKLITLFLVALGVLLVMFQLLK